MKQFLTTGIPKILEPRPDISKKPVTIEQVEIIMEHNDTAILPVAGDCLEGVGVIDGGWVAVDFTRFPAPPRHKSRGGDGSEDICLCYAVFPGQILPAVMLKAYAGVWGTRPASRSSWKPRRRSPAATSGTLCRLKLRSVRKRDGRGRQWI